MKHYDFQTGTNTGSDFANTYALIFKIPLNKGITDNWLGDTQFSFDVLWQSSYHYHRVCRYSVSIRQDLSGAEISQLDTGKQTVANGVGYKVVAGEAIYFYVHSGVQNMPVRINVTGSSSSNIFVEEMPNEPFTTIEGLTFAYEVGQEDVKTSIFHYLELVEKSPVYTGEVGGDNIAILDYTSPNSVCGFVDVVVTIYSNEHTGNGQIIINDTKEYVRETVELSDSSDTVKRYKFPVCLNQGQHLTIYFAQWTGTNVNAEVKLSISRGE
jgi:hypothetical protein